MNNIKNTKSNSEKKYVKDIKIFLKKKKEKKRKVRDRYKNLPEEKKNKKYMNI